jgi:hypothetical protein
MPPMEILMAQITTNNRNSRSLAMFVVKSDIKKDIPVERKKIEKFKKSELGDPFSSRSSSLSVISYKLSESTRPLRILGSLLSIVG